MVVDEIGIAEDGPGGRGVEWAVDKGVTAGGWEEGGGMVSKSFISFIVAELIEPGSQKVIKGASKWWSITMSSIQKGNKILAY